MRANVDKGARALRRVELDLGFEVAVDDVLPPASSRGDVAQDSHEQLEQAVGVRLSPWRAGRPTARALALAPPSTTTARSGALRERTSFERLVLELERFRMTLPPESGEPASLVSGRPVVVRRAVASTSSTASGANRYTWQRDKMVGKSAASFDVTRMSIAHAGGSSSVFNSVFAAVAFIRSASTKIETRRLTFERLETAFAHDLSHARRP